LTSSFFFLCVFENNGGLQIIFFVLLGIFGGLYGAFVIKFNLRAQAFRKKYLAAYPITEVVFLALITAILCYWNAWLRIDMTEEMERLFKQCEGVEDYSGICL
jgi:chloride channel 3/4/5